MVTAAAWLIALAVALGATAWVVSAQRQRAAPAPLAAAHVAAAVAGFLLLLRSLPTAPRNEANGTASFGVIAAWCFAAALVVGIGMLALRWRRGRVVGALIGLHAMIAVSGFVILAVYALLS